MFSYLFIQWVLDNLSFWSRPWYSAENLWMIKINNFFIILLLANTHLNTMIDHILTLRINELLLTLIAGWICNRVLSQSSGNMTGNSTNSQNVYYNKCQSYLQLFHCYWIYEKNISRTQIGPCLDAWLCVVGWSYFSFPEANVSLSPGI